ncbi:hypothetical protein OGE23_003567 [Vibrio cholerae]|nr:hypothetical protein [Vibrio cholerae]EKF9810535.1 hypothetical protein [Vibrio cholerae]
MSFGPKYLEDFNRRFQEFREIEHEVISTCKANRNASPKAFSLVYEMELCYSAGAYYACLILACSSIEASLSKEVDGRSLYEMLKHSGYEDEISWLRCLRNNLVHGQDVEAVYHFPQKEQLDMLIKQCQRAFKLVHQLYYEPLKK